MFIKDIIFIGGCFDSTDFWNNTLKAKFSKADPHKYNGF
jgi:hypothetical protein